MYEINSNGKGCLFLSAFPGLTANVVAVVLSNLTGVVARDRWVIYMMIARLSFFRINWLNIIIMRKLTLIIQQKRQKTAHCQMNLGNINILILIFIQAAGNLEITIR